jgi:hypothetical protein
MTINSDPIDIFHFRLGLIEPAVVIELGLDFGLAHLKGDIEKLENSKVKHRSILPEQNVSYKMKLRAAF